MSTTDLFAQATRLKLRFNTTKGVIGVEDIWDLPLQHPTRLSLNDVANTVHRELKAEPEELDFISTTEGLTKAEDPLPPLRLAIVKHIITVKVEEKRAREAASAKEDLKARLKEALAEKKGEEFKGLSAAELQAQLDAL